MCHLLFADYLISFSFALINVPFRNNIGIVTLYGQPSKKARDYPHIKAQYPEYELRCVFFFKVGDRGNVRDVPTTSISFRA